MSNILNYFVGQAPLNPISIEIRNSDGSKKDCTFYDRVEVQLIGSDNEIVDLSGAELNGANLVSGDFTLRWPRPSVFRKSGRYLLQAILSTNDGYRDATSVAEIRVRDPRRGGN